MRLARVVGHATAEGERDVVPDWTLLQGDCLDVLKTLPADSVHCCVTSPPYYALRAYLTVGHPDKALEVGSEKTPEEYVVRLVEVFREVRRVLHPSGCLFCNLGDSYCTVPHGPKGANTNDPKWAGGRNRGSQNGQPNRQRMDGYKHKDLLGIPWLVAFALRADGWYLRSAVRWCKVSPMPESVRDRPTSAVEEVFLLTKRPKYFYDQEAERVANVSDDDLRNSQDYEPKRERNKGGRTDGYTTSSGAMTWNPSGRNLWNYWADISPSPVEEAHFATMPKDLASRCIRLGSSEKGCCAECGAPWGRVVERERISTRPKSRPVGVSRGRQPSSCCYLGQPQQSAQMIKTITTGWRPGCECGSETVPCTILDPFAGSGTTLIVAHQLGRRSVGIELNSEYCDMARRRLAAGLVKDDTLPQRPADALPLFGE